MAGIIERKGAKMVQTGCGLQFCSYVYDWGIDDSTSSIYRLYDFSYCLKNNISLIRIPYRDKSKINDQYIYDLVMDNIK